MAAHKLAEETPLPMDNDDLPVDPSGEAGYAPVRRRKQKDMILEPADVECAVETVMEEDTTAEAGEWDVGKAPYAKPQFPALDPAAQGLKKQLRRIPVPPNRMTPLKTHWMSLIEPVVEHLKLQVRMNTKRRAVEIRNSYSTEDISFLQKASDYFRAFMLGFDQQDAIALLRLDDLFLESFMVKDVKLLRGEHLSRAIGRVAGHDGKTKYAIENATRTRIALNDDKIHILGSFVNIRLARHSICSLILGNEPGSVYTKLRTVSKRIQERI